MTRGSKEAIPFNRERSPMGVPREEAQKTIDENNNELGRRSYEDFQGNVEKSPTMHTESNKKRNDSNNIVENIHFYSVNPTFEINPKQSTVEGHNSRGPSNNDPRVTSSQMGNGIFLPSI